MVQTNSCAYNTQGEGTDEWAGGRQQWLPELAQWHIKHTPKILRKLLDEWHTLEMLGLEWVQVRQCSNLKKKKRMCVCTWSGIPQTNIFKELERREWPFVGWASSVSSFLPVCRVGSTAHFWHCREINLNYQVFWVTLLNVLSVLKFLLRLSNC